MRRRHQAADEDVAGNGPMSPRKQDSVTMEIGQSNTEKSPDQTESKTHVGDENANKPEKGSSKTTESPQKFKFSTVKPPPTFDAFLGHVVTFGAIMFYFYLCDFYKVSENVNILRKKVQE